MILALPTFTQGNIRHEMRQHKPLLVIVALALVAAGPPDAPEALQPDDPADVKTVQHMFAQSFSWTATATHRDPCLWVRTCASPPCSDPRCIA